MQERTQTEKIRRIIENFTSNPRKPQDDYKKYLVKCATLLELDAQLNELENLEPSKEDTYERRLYDEQVQSIGAQVRKTIWS